MTFIQKGTAMTKAIRTALYVRVSTIGQTVENQLRELQEVAERHGWNVVAIFKDEGISGAKGRDRRPGLDRLLKAVTRREVDLVAAWSVDRLGPLPSRFDRRSRRASRQGLRSLFAPTRDRYPNARWKSNVSNARCVRRI